MHDDELRGLLRTLERDHEPDPTFVDSLYQHLLPARGSRRVGPVILLAAALVAALLTGVALGSGLLPPPAALDATPTAPVSASASGPSEASPTPLATASASTSLAPATPSPTPAALPAPNQILPSGAMLRVTGTGLRIREAPSLAAAIVTTAGVGEILYTTAPMDPRLAPRAADGYDWYPVEYAADYQGWPELPPADERIIGYVAARSAAEWFVELIEPACPSAVPDLATLVELTPYERVACLGARSVTLEGTYGCPACDSLSHPYVMEPAWLAAWHLHLSWFAPGWEDPSPGLIVVVTPPGVPEITEAERGRVLRVTGHFNDPQAQACTITPQAAAGPAAAPHPEAVEWYCRDRFVVERWEVIGTDPDFAELEPS